MKCNILFFVAIYSTQVLVGNSNPIYAQSKKDIHKAFIKEANVYPINSRKFMTSGVKKVSIGEYNSSEFNNQITGSNDNVMVQRPTVSKKGKEIETLNRKKQLSFQVFFKNRESTISSTEDYFSVSYQRFRNDDGTSIKESLIFMLRYAKFVDSSFQESRFFANIKLDKDSNDTLSFYICATAKEFRCNIITRENNVPKAIKIQRSIHRGFFRKYENFHIFIENKMVGTCDWKNMWILKDLDEPTQWLVMNLFFALFQYHGITYSWKYYY